MGSSSWEAVEACRVKHQSSLVGQLPVVSGNNGKIWLSCETNMEDDF